MKPEIADRLTRITNRFYRQQAASFSATRQAPWTGWGRCLAVWEREAGNRSGGAVPVLDVGCGNLRFERYLEQAHAAVPWAFSAVDDCRPLVAAALRTQPVRAPLCYQNLNVMPALGEGASALAGALEAPPALLAVCFGLLHHVPTFERRAALLRALVHKTQPGGVVCVSFWRFMANNKLAARTRALQPQALADCNLTVGDLDADDYLLGWNAQPGVYRYCHHFGEREIDRLVASLGPAVRVVDRFVSDGRTGDLNAYLVLQPLPPEHC